jgi:hypothetical protein
MFNYSPDKLSLADTQRYIEQGPEAKRRVVGM